MSKVLKAEELGGMIARVTARHQEIEGSSDSFKQFLQDLQDAVCNFLGSTPGGVDFVSDDDLGWTVSFRIDEMVPPDGGIFKDYDTDVTWKDGEEQ
jgi:hypothetical protein